MGRKDFKIQSLGKDCKNILSKVCISYFLVNIKYINLGYLSYYLYIFVVVCYLL